MYGFDTRSAQAAIVQTEHLDSQRHMMHIHVQEAQFEQQSSKLNSVFALLGAHVSLTAVIDPVESCDSSKQGEGSRRN